MKRVIYLCRFSRSTGFSLVLLLSLVLATFTGVAHAAPVHSSEEQERIYLVQLVNQLNAMLPLVMAAQKMQPPHQRVSFHYTAWHDDKGQRRNGLLEDVQAIKAGIEQKLNSIAIEPRSVQPVRGDYLDPAQPTR